MNKLLVAKYISKSHFMLIFPDNLRNPKQEVHFPTTKCIEVLKKKHTVDNTIHYSLAFHEYSVLRYKIKNHKPFGFKEIDS